MKQVFPYLLILSIICTTCSDDEDQLNDAVEISAEATFFAMEKSAQQFAGTSFSTYDVDFDDVLGTASFEQVGDVVKLTIQIEGQTPNSAGAIHIHHGDLNRPERHWNQLSLQSFCQTKTLGRPWARPAAGDVGNISFDENGEGTFVIETDLWALNSGNEKDVLEKVIVVHQDPQDFVEECDPNHSHLHLHNNPKIGIGKIELLTATPLKAQMDAVGFPEFTICK